MELIGIAFEFFACLTLGTNVISRFLSKRNPCTSDGFHRSEVCQYPPLKSIKKNILNALLTIRFQFDNIWNGGNRLPRACSLREAQVNR